MSLLSEKRYNIDIQFGEALGWIKVQYAVNAVYGQKDTAMEGQRSTSGYPDTSVSD